MDDVKKLTPEETVAALRHCVNELHCMECVMYPHLRGGKCTMKLCAAAADTIEELLAQTPLALIVPDVDLSEERLAMFREEMRTAVIMPDGAEPSIEFVQQGWIPVTDRLPDKEFWEFQKQYEDEDLEVQVMIKGAKRPTTLYYNDEGEFYSMDGDGPTFYLVTHWAPLMEPPKED